MGTSRTRPASARAARYEAKYYVSADAQSAIRAFIAPYVTPDRYAALRPGFTYPVYSLYLDSPSLGSYRASAQGLRNRFKLRVRNYHVEASEPYFLEIKRRVGPSVVKSRTPVDATVASDIVAMCESCCSSSVGKPANSIRDEFVAKMAATHAVPAVCVRYNREAYESRERDAVRITFDIDLAYAPARPGGLPLTGGAATCAGDDVRAWRSLPVPGVILEIKFTDRYPGWVQTLVQRFDLMQRSIPKYCMSVTHAALGASRGYAPYTGTLAALWAAAPRA